MTISYELANKMAAQRESNSQTVEACCVAEPDQPSVTTAQDPPSINQGTRNEPEYDFVEQPDQDCFCPVSLELLTEPYLTTCCGHHISQQAADRLIRERKPCPMCKEGDFTAHVDKYFKRKFINTLKVCCSHKKSGCEWVGELGDLNNHSTSCPKRPWKCQYCGLESTIDVGTNEHTPNCAQYPLPCPNQCEIGTVPRCDAEKHLLVCPLQLVECKFANVGCEVKVPRRDLIRHMTENAQHHLMSTTLLNLRLTRELHQKMEEKDQQIAELKQQLNEHEVKMREESKTIVKNLEQQVDVKLQQQTQSLNAKLQQQTERLDVRFEQQTRSLDTKYTERLDAKLQQQTTRLDAKLQQQTTRLDAKLQQQTTRLDAKLQQQTTRLDAQLQQQTKGIDIKFQQQSKDLDAKLHQQTELFNTKLQRQTEVQDTKFQQLTKEQTALSQMVEHHHTELSGKLLALESKLLLEITYTSHELTLVNFKKCQGKGGDGSWYSDPFYSGLRGYRFLLNIDTNGHGNARNTHLTAYLKQLKNEFDKELQWPIKFKVYLEIINQRGDHSNHSRVGTVQLSSADSRYECIGDDKFFPLNGLAYNARTNTEYLRNDSIKFRLRLKVV